MGFDMNAQELPRKAAYLWNGQGSIWVLAKLACRTNTVPGLCLRPSLLLLRLRSQNRPISRPCCDFFHVARLGLQIRHVVYTLNSSRERETYLHCVKKKNKSAGRCTLGNVLLMIGPVHAGVSGRWVGSDIVRNGRAHKTLPTK